MPAPSQFEVGNRLLKTMAPKSFERLKPDLELVELPQRQSLVDSDVPISHLHFLEMGLASVVAANADSEEIEVGHVGWEGLCGATALLGVPQTPTRTFMQIAGRAYRIPTEALKAATLADESLREHLLRYIHTMEIQLAHSALANGRYSMHERLARWLLMCHDRVEGDSLPLTHEFLSLMLGVRRSGVTNEIHILEGLGIIKATRALIRVVDRTRLEEMAGGSYGLPEREYEALIGVPLKSDT